ncbi:MAG: hypothetical protein ACI4F9_04170 [Lachnospiraceae bacterium]
MQTKKTERKRVRKKFPQNYCKNAQKQAKKIRGIAKNNIYNEKSLKFTQKVILLMQTVAQNNANNNAKTKSES